MQCSVSAGTVNDSLPEPVLFRYAIVELSCPSIALWTKNPPEFLLPFIGNILSTEMVYCVPGVSAYDAYRLIRAELVDVPLTLMLPSLFGVTVIPFFVTVSLPLLHRFCLVCPYTFNCLMRPPPVTEVSIVAMSVGPTCS